MRLLLQLFGFTALSALVVSCSKELSSENNEAPVVIDAAWEFTENAITYKGDIDTAYLADQPNTQFLTMEGSGTDGKTGSMVLQIIDAQIETGTYTSPKIYFQYSENGAVIFENILYDPGFVVTITHIDSVSISGTFSGTVQGQAGAQHTITDGKFTAAIEGLDSDDQPELEDNYFPLTKSWTYQNADDENDKLIITSTSTEIIDGKTYTIFENSRTLEKKYYRRDGDNVYEYVNFNFGLPGSSQPALDLLILKADANVGDTPWETDPLNVTISGIPVTVKIVSEVVSKEDQLMVNGIIYNNVIEVDTQIYVWNGTDFELIDGLGYTTLFAQGYGIVYYVERTDKSRWTLNSYSKE